MSNSEEPIVVWHDASVSRAERERLNRHSGCVVWFTGLSGSGKSTVANAVDRLLHDRGVRTYVLDGDNVRHGLNATPAMLTEKYDEEFGQRFGLGFGQQDREENIRRVGAVAKLMCDAGLVVLTAFVSPYRADRDAVRAAINSGDENAGDGAASDFFEVFVDTPLEVCELRDPKGLYQKARAGEIKNFTGIDAPYEAPRKAELALAAGEQTPADLARQVVEYLVNVGKIASS